MYYNVHMNITIAGYGFVGKAIEAYLHEAEHTTHIVCLLYTSDAADE